jgi:hypothetical protein
VHDIDRDHRGEAAVGKRQFHAVAKVKPADHLRLAMHQRVFGDVEPEHLDTGTDPQQILDQKPLGATDIEHPVAGLEAPMLDHVLGHAGPETRIVAVAAITGGARAVEIVASVFARDPDVFGALRVGALLDVALAPRVAAQQVDLGHAFIPLAPRRAA